MKNIYYEEIISFKIGPKLINQYNVQSYILPRITLLKGKVTMYAPRVFNKILNLDQIEDIELSFDLIKNCNQIYKLFER